MEQTSSLTRKLAAAQDHVVTKGRKETYRYEIFTTFSSKLLELVARYFKDASIVPVLGAWVGQGEAGAIVVIVAPLDQLQDVFSLCGDIKATTHETILLGYAPVSTWEF